MNPLISLIWRILSGEKLEPATKENTAYWLSALAVLPLSIVGFASLAGWLESAVWSPFENTVSIILFVVPYCLVIFGASVLLAKTFGNYPGFLLLLSCGAWGSTAFLLWRHA